MFKQTQFYIPFSYIVYLLIAVRIFVYIYFFVTEARIVHPDSGHYLELASQFIMTGEYYLPTIQPQIIEPFGIPLEDTIRAMITVLPEGPDVFRPPGYPAFLILLHWLGIDDPYGIVFIQELLYGLTVYIFYRYGSQLFNKTLVQLTVIYLMIGVGGLIWPKYLIAESIFFMFVLVSLLAVGMYLKNGNARTLIFAGFAMGLGTLTRPALQFFPLVTAITILIFDIRNKKKWLHSGAMLIVFLLTVSPWLIRNYYHYNHIIMSGQASNLITYFHVSTLKSYKENTTPEDGWRMVGRTIKKLVEEKEQEIGRKINAVEILKLQLNWGINELSKDPLLLTQYWIISACKNMYEPYVIDLYYALRVNRERPHLLAIMKGHSGNAALDNPENEWQMITTARRLIYYFQNQDLFYLFVTSYSFLMFVLALVGVFAIIKKRDCFLWLIMLANFYFVFLPGLTVFGRYRFPVDHFLFMQACMGLVLIYQIIKFLSAKVLK